MLKGIALRIGLGESQVGVLHLLPRYLKSCKNCPEDFFHAKLRSGYCFLPASINQNSQ